MSTRSNILVKGQGEERWLYRHHDGYPTAAMVAISEALTKRLWRKRGAYQQGGVAKVCEYLKEAYEKLEDTGGKSGDIEYLYTIDLDAETVTIRHHKYYQSEHTPKEVTITFDRATFNDLEEVLR